MAVPKFFVLFCIFAASVLSWYAGRHALAQKAGILLAVTSGVILIWRGFVYPTFFDPLRTVPGPRSRIPLVGWGLTPFRTPPSREVYKWITTIPNDGLVRFQVLPGFQILIPTSPKCISDLLMSRSYDFQKPDGGRNLLRLVLGDGLVVSEGEVHRFQRKNLNPMFSFRHVKDLYPVIWSKSVALTERISSEISSSRSAESGAVLEVNIWTSRATLGIIGVTALGQDLNTLYNTQNELVQHYEWLFNFTNEKIMWTLASRFIPSALLNCVPWKVNKDMHKSAKALRRLCKGFVVDKRNLMGKDGEAVDTLAHLIRSNNFSDDDLVDQLLTLLAAGHETTSSGFTWALYLLATQQKIRTALREELLGGIGQIPPSGDSTKLSSILESLPLLNGVCMETLRLYPPVHNTRRTAVNDTTIGNFRIPAGTEFLIPVWWLNRHPSLWGSDSEDFNPTRWIDTETGKPNNQGGACHNAAFLTFLTGPRNCIGQGFAKAELRSLIAAWMLKFDFELAKPQEEVIPFGFVTVKPKQGLYLRVKPLQL